MLPCGESCDYEILYGLILFSINDFRVVIFFERPSTILIADDDPIFLGIATTMVRSIGYPVITAPNGVDALELFTKNENSIGLVLLDINMPGMNGVDVFQHIRTLCKEVKVVIVSRCVNDKIRKQLSPLSPTAYIKKPISFDVLSGVLNSTSSR